MTYIKRRRTKGYTATGAIDPNYSVHAINGSSALTMTLTNPAPHQDGVEIEVICTTAYAHILTVSGGFGGDANRATFTFRGNINDSVRLIAYNSLWYISGKGDGAFDLTQNYTSSGALNPIYELHSIDVAGVGAMTLAAATASLEGRRMAIVTTTGNAHTVTYTPGFGGLSTSGDVATFGGAVGDSMTIVCIDGVWHIESLNNVTLG